MRVYQKGYYIRMFTMVFIMVAPNQKQLPYLLVVSKLYYIDRIGCCPPTGPVALTSEQKLCLSVNE